MAGINSILDSIKRRTDPANWGGGGGGSIRGALSGEFSAGRASANRANEARYRQALGLYDRMGLGARMGVRQRSQQQLATTKQDLINRGLGGSTILGAMQRRSVESESEQMFNISDAIARAKAGIIERRTDLGPDAGAYTGLMRDAAEGEDTRPQIPRGLEPADDTPIAPAAKPKTPAADAGGYWYRDSRGRVRWARGKPTGLIETGLHRGETLYERPTKAQAPGLTDPADIPAGSIARAIYA